VSTSPFVSDTTPAIETANRLLAVRVHPGFLDVLRISQRLVEESAAVLVDYGGWDPQQIMVLKARAQAAKEHHHLLLVRINEAIEMGTNDQRELAPTLPSKSAEEIIEQGDFVRQEVLTKFAEMDDNRIPGSY